MAILSSVPKRWRIVRFAENLEEAPATNVEELEAALALINLVSQRSPIKSAMKHLPSTLDDGNGQRSSTLLEQSNLASESRAIESAVVG